MSDVNAMNHIFLINHTTDYLGQEISVLHVLSTDDLVMKYKEGSLFKAKLVDGQGKAYAGQSVQFNTNEVLYNKVTDDDSITKLNINLMSGEYIITSSYNDFNTANKITIRGLKYPNYFLF